MITPNNSNNSNNSNNPETQIVYNDCYGGFGLSEEAVSLLNKKKDSKDSKDSKYSNQQIPRHDKDLIQVVLELKEKASDRFANLQIGTITGSLYIIDEYDGLESILTPNDIAWIDAEQKDPNES